jgi:AhpD family alkylhydroperoxidase
MSRLAIPPTDELPSGSKPAIDAVERRLGVVPNMQRLLATSPAVIEGVTSFQSALNKTLDARTRNGIALAVSEVNGCNYCQRSHAFYANTLGKISREEIDLNRQGRSSDSKRAAALHFARQVIETRGKVSMPRF